jgi:hypothetical protein
MNTVTVSYEEMLLDSIAIKIMEGYLKNFSWDKIQSMDELTETCYTQALTMYETGKKYKAKL